eukprot:scaffold1720_cov353-Pavlova_lutheri.AAC.4
MDQPHQVADVFVCHRSDHIANLLAHGVRSGVDLAFTNLQWSGDLRIAESLPPTRSRREGSICTSHLSHAHLSHCILSTPGCLLLRTRHSVLHPHADLRFGGFSRRLHGYQQLRRSLDVSSGEEPFQYGHLCLCGLPSRPTHPSRHSHRQLVSVLVSSLVGFSRHAPLGRIREPFGGRGQRVFLHPVPRRLLVSSDAIQCEAVLQMVASLRARGNCVAREKEPGQLWHPSVWDAREVNNTLTTWRGTTKDTDPTHRKSQSCVRGGRCSRGAERGETIRPLHGINCQVMNVLVGRVPLSRRGCNEAKERRRACKAKETSKRSIFRTSIIHPMQQSDSEANGGGESFQDHQECTPVAFACECTIQDTTSTQTSLACIKGLIPTNKLPRSSAK